VTSAIDKIYLLYYPTFLHIAEIHETITSIKSGILKSQFLFFSIQPEIINCIFDSVKNFKQVGLAGNENIHLRICTPRLLLWYFLNDFICLCINQYSLIIYTRDDGTLSDILHNNIINIILIKTWFNCRITAGYQDKSQCLIQQFMHLREFVQVLMLTTFVYYLNWK